VAFTEYFLLMNLETMEKTYNIAMQCKTEARKAKRFACSHSVFQWKSQWSISRVSV